MPFDNISEAVTLSRSGPFKDVWNMMDPLRKLGWLVTYLALLSYRKEVVTGVPIECPRRPTRASQTTAVSLQNATHKCIGKHVQVYIYIGVCVC